MKVKENVIILFAILGVICFFIGIGSIVSSAIKDEDIQLMPFFIGFGLMILMPVIGLGLDIMFNKKRPSYNSEKRKASPSERFEGGSINYCPMCHASLGSNVPDKCPECGIELFR